MTLPSAVTVELSKLEFDVVWGHLRLGPFPTVYRMMGHGQTDAERARLVEQAWRSLHAKGLGSPGSPDARLSELLRVLATPEREVDARMNHGDRVLRARACARIGRAALGVLDGDVFRFSEITPGGLSKAVVGLLPEHPAGVGTSVTLPSAVFSAACSASANTPRGLRNALVERGVRREDATMLADALGDVVGAGQFGAARIDRWATRRRAGHVVGFVDSGGGRFLLEARPPTSGGEQWTTVAPTDPTRLAGQIDRLLAELDREFGGEPRG